MTWTHPYKRMRTIQIMACVAQKIYFLWQHCGYSPPNIMLDYAYQLFLTTTKSGLTWFGLLLFMNHDPKWDNVRSVLTHWGRMTHIYVGKLTFISSDNGLSPGRRQAIIWTNAGLLSIGPLRTYVSGNLIKIQQLSLEKMHVKMSSAKWRPSCLGLNVLMAASSAVICVVADRLVKTTT